MWIDAIALGLLLLFAGLGAWRGGLASGGGLACLAIAYAAAIVVARDYGAALADKTNLAPLVASPLAGFLAFLGAYLLSAAALGWLKRWDRVRRGGLPRGALDRLIGAGFGALRGAGVVLLLTWLAIWLDAARELGSAKGLDGMPETRSSGAVALTQNAIEGALMWSLDDAGSGGRLLAHAAARPVQAIGGFQELLEDDRIRALQEDGLFWTYVEHGSIESALNRGSFRRILVDSDLREELADLGVISEDAAGDAKRFREDAGRVLGEIGPRVRGLKNDPEMQSLARDPEVVRLLESGDTLGLIRHPGVQSLMTRVSSGG